MEKQIITEKMIDEFKEYLILAEKSDATIEKYIRDVRAFAAYAQSGSVTKETVIAFWLTLLKWWKAAFAAERLEILPAIRVCAATKIRNTMICLNESM